MFLILIYLARTIFRRQRRHFRWPLFLFPKYILHWIYNELIKKGKTGVFFRSLKDTWLLKMTFLLTLTESVRERDHLSAKRISTHYHTTKSRDKVSGSCIIKIEVMWNVLSNIDTMLAVKESVMINNTYKKVLFASQCYMNIVVFLITTSYVTWK